MCQNNNNKIIKEIQQTTESKILGRQRNCNQYKS